MSSVNPAVIDAFFSAAPEPGDAGIGADGQEVIYEADGWQPVPEPEAGG